MSMVKILNSLLTAQTINTFVLDLDSGTPIHISFNIIRIGHGSLLRMALRSLFISHLQPAANTKNFFCFFFLQKYNTGILL